MNIYQSARQVELDLTARPIIRHAGINTHGRPRRRHEHYSALGTWSLHIYRYDAELRVDGESYSIRPGRATLLPPDATLEFRYHAMSTHACVHFSVGADAVNHEGAREVVSIPLMQDLGSARHVLNVQLEHVIANHAAHPIRAAVGLWDLLWNVAEAADRQAVASKAGSATVPDVVKQVLAVIELRLNRPLYVSRLAAEMQMSHAHLTRLFRAATGNTIAGHITRRRSERAADLLIHTRMPTKTIAAQVGVPDLHQFNKLIRRIYGVSPSTLRERGR